MTETKEKIERLKPWFHNLHLPDGTQTAPDHFLGDFPKFKWDEIKNSIPENLAGLTALDIGCNAGFYTFELAKRGADVLGIDLDPHYLEQAEWAAEVFGLREKVEFRQMQVYDLAKSETKYDIIIFMGVLYHLRYPLLALDIVTQKVKKMMVFQTLTMPGEKILDITKDLGINERDLMRDEGWPKMAFIEGYLAGDPTNWWAPNNAAIIAMLRSCGMNVIKRPGHEIYICEPFSDRKSVIDDWNMSEFLSATGHNWQKDLNKKVNK